MFLIFLLQALRVSAPSTLNETTKTVPSSTADTINNEYEVCGKSVYPQSRIMGGDQSSFAEWPWQISLGVKWPRNTSHFQHNCGAVLLNSNWAATAAHCLLNFRPRSLMLRLGEHDFNRTDEPYHHEDRRILKILRHPLYNLETFEYDLALMKFSKPVAFRVNILPVCLPNQSVALDNGKKVYVTGWGRIFDDGPVPNVLRHAKIEIINNTACESMFWTAGYEQNIPEEIFLCAGLEKGGSDACTGDSGGPLVMKQNGRFILVGITSWGIDCGQENQPGVYTRIAEFSDWINEHINS